MIEKQKLTKFWIVLIILCLSKFCFSLLPSSVDYNNINSFPCAEVGFIDCEVIPTLITWTALETGTPPAFGLQVVAIVLFSLVFAQNKLRNFFVFYSFAFYSLFEVYIFQSVGIAIFLLGGRYLVGLAHLPTFLVTYNLRIFKIALFALLAILFFPNILNWMWGWLNYEPRVMSYIRDYSTMYNVEELNLAPTLWIKMFLLYILGASGWAVTYLIALFSTIVVNEIFARFLSIIFMVAIVNLRYKFSLFYFLAIFVGISTNILEIYRDHYAA
ncbi:hypothetical protein N9Y14_00565 [Alphaproteobacteria bacterium]|nr:hypothetical protein [Alphaproteobacteria bacterium]MDB2406725.1 hypothetical protein [Alphaproteobacteria bacterium]MDB2540623.1 hypothetical protein [Alphaproteobacteria bacterium]MDB2649018.1 hypothetical protein [Alphaproteobacteria bacterium]